MHFELCDVLARLHASKERADRLWRVSVTMDPESGMMSDGQPRLLPLPPTSFRSSFRSSSKLLVLNPKQQILSTYTSHPNPASNLEESQHGPPLLLPTSHLRILLQHFQHPPRLVHLSSRTLHPSSPTRHPRPVLRRRKRPQAPHPDRRRHLRWGRRRRCGRREWGCHG